MGLLDRARKFASGLVARLGAGSSDARPAAAGGTADTQEADRLLRDLGVLAYRELTGQQVDAAQRDRLRGALEAMEQQGRLGPLTLR